MPQFQANEIVGFAAQTAKQSDSLLWNTPTERFIIAYASPLLGLNAILIGTIALLHSVPELRFELGVTAAAAGCLYLACLTVRGRLADQDDAFHTGAAAATLLFALLAPVEPLVALVGTLTAIVFAAALIARGKVHEFAAILPAVYLPVLSSILQPDWSLILGAVVPLLACVGLYVLGRPAAAIAILVSPLLLERTTEEFTALWLGILVIACFSAFLCQFGRAWRSRRRSNIVAFVGEGIALLLTLKLCGILVGDPATAIWITAGISAASALVRSIAERRPAAERAAWTALLLTLGILRDAPNHDLTSMVTLSSPTLLLIAIALQGVSVWACNRFSSRIALAIALYACVWPFAAAGLLFGEPAVISGDVLAVSFGAAATLALFARRIRGRPEAWWRGLVPARNMVGLRRWARNGWRSVGHAPVIGPSMSVLMGLWSLLKRAGDDGTRIGLPEAVTVVVHLYVLLILTSQIHVTAMAKGLSPTTDLVLVSLLWAALGSATFLVGRWRGRAYLRITGLGLILAPIAFAVIFDGRIAWTYLAIVEGLALVAVGVAAQPGLPPRAVRSLVVSRPDGADL